MKRRTLITAALALVLATSIAVATASASSSGKPSLTVYSGQHPDTIATLVKAFEQKTGIHVNVLSNTDASLATLIVLQGSASPADVFLAENSPALEVLRQRGLLAKVAGGTLAKVPSFYSAPEGDWLPMAAHSSVLVYNTEKLKRSQVPHSVLELAKPAWKGKLAVAPSETDFQPIVVAVEQKLGQSNTLAWIEGLGTNSAGNVYANNAGIVEQVNVGTAEIGVIDPYYWYALRDQIGVRETKSAIAYLAPGDPGYVVDVSGAGIIKSSTHQAEDQEFLAYMLSPQGQKALSQGESYEYPIVPGLPTPKPLPPLASLHPDPITPTALGNGQIAATLLQQAGLL